MLLLLLLQNCVVCVLVLITHNERKVTCKHPVSGIPSQDNCIFVVNEQSAPKAPANEKKERLLSNMSEASNYTGGSDYSPAGRDSTGMKLWKKRWFVLSDLCLFYYRDEKEEGILGSILLPSFHVSMLSVDDHINRKYAFKVTLLDRLMVEQCGPQEINHLSAEIHRPPLTRPEIQNNERNREVDREHPVMNITVTPTPTPSLTLNTTTPTLSTTPTSTTPTPISTPTPSSEEQDRRQREAERYGFQKDGGEYQRPLTKINSIKLQPAQASASAASASTASAASTASTVSHPRTPTEMDGPHRGAPQVNGVGGVPGDRSPCGGGGGGVPGDRSPCGGGVGGGDGPAMPQPQQHHPPPQLRPGGQEPERSLSRTSSMQQLEQWVRTQRGRGQDDDTRSIASYQTLPRNMPSYRGPAMHQPGEGYRTMPRNGLGQRDSICSMSPSMYDQALGPAAGDKRRSMRDDTMWQLFEWQQRNAYTHPPQQQPPSALYANMPSPKTMINLSEHAMPPHAIPPSPSHGSLSMYGGYSPLRSYNMSRGRSEVSSPYAYSLPPDRRSMPSGIPVQMITAQSLQGKTLSPEDYRDHPYMCRPEEADVDTKLSRLCEQDKVVRAQEGKVQQLHREKSVVQQRDLLQSGLLGTCRELSRVSAELDRSWREYDRLEGDVGAARTSLLERLEALGSPQTEPPSQQHVSIQKELWRIQDVMEALSKHRPQRHGPDGSMHMVEKQDHQHHQNQKRQQQQQQQEEPVPPRPPLPQSYESDAPSVPPLPSLVGMRPTTLHRPDERKNGQRNGAHSGPDYRLYKSEPELTTVAEVDESNGEDRNSANKGSVTQWASYPPEPNPPMMDSSSIASYVTLRKGRRPDPRNERPRSAMDQLGAAESGRPRMSVEEQLERIRRHQQGALREKKKAGLSVLGGGQETTPSRSPSFTRETPPRGTQMQSRRREEVMSTDIQELENALRMQDVVRDQETPAQEIARLKEASHHHHFNMDRELAVPDKVVIPERYVESDPEDAPSPEQEADKQKKVDRIKALIARNSMQSAPPMVPVSPEDEAEAEATVQEKEKMINISYELAAEASKRSKLVAGYSQPRMAQ
ncbi:hypothetical protein CRUP_004168 [Coryphaenoides rupestris]|nr:hypothetical protein CRUP_004168 [Coryphaenoides rupestris]